METFEFGSASFKGQFIDGTLYLSGLESEGNVSDLLAIVAAVKEIAKSIPVILSVDSDNPKREKLMKFYKRYGAEEVITLLRVK